MPTPLIESDRDYRLDFFRGVALFFIFVDHIPGNVLSYFTLHSICFADAAEVFIFISGYTAALVYGRVLQRRGVLLALAKIYHRVWRLYVAHIFLSVIFTAVVSYTATRWNIPSYYEEMRLAEFLSAPHVAVVQAMMLRFQPMFLDILPLYIILLFCFPFILFLTVRWSWLALALSFALYVATQIFHLSFGGYPEGHVWFFNPLAWQFVFVIGAVCGYAPVGGRSLPSSRWLFLAAVSVVALLAALRLTWALNSFSPRIPAVLADQIWPVAGNKTDLAPLRLLNFIALALVVMHLVPKQSSFLRRSLARPVVLCGQHSLEIFCLGILLSVLAHFVLTQMHGGITMQVALTAFGLTVMILVSLLLDWYKTANTGGLTRVTPVGTASKAGSPTGQSVANTLRPIA